jgi:hypothetical protein
MRKERRTRRNSFPSQTKQYPLPTSNSDGAAPRRSRALEAEVIRRTKEKYDPRFITEEEETAAIDSLSKGALDVFEHKLRKVERAIKRKNKASAVRRLARIATIEARGGA